METRKGFTIVVSKVWEKPEFSGWRKIIAYVKKEGRYRRDFMHIKRRDTIASMWEEHKKMLIPTG